MTKILVTGASGFIGDHLVTRCLADGWRVRALVRDRYNGLSTHPKIEVVRGDVRDAEAMTAAAAGVDVVFHLAGKVHALSEVGGSDAEYREVNVTGTRNVLQGAVAGGAQRVVFFSSVKAIGEGGPACFDESSEAKPTTPYGRSKLEAEDLVLELGGKTGLHVACLRLPVVYGPGNKGNLSRMIAAIDRGFFPPLTETGNRRSMVHVTNVVEAAWVASTRAEANGQGYIVTDARPYSTRELYEAICGALGRRVPRWSVPVGLLAALGRVGDAAGRVRGRRFGFDSDALDKLIGSAWYSSAKVTRELGYRPVIGLREALPELIRWYRSIARAIR